MESTPNSEQIDGQSVFSDNKGNAPEPIKVDMRGQRPINDPKCNHDWYLAADDPDSAWADIWKCRKCPLGMPVAKSK